MHEFSLAKNICDLVQKRFDQTRYHRVTKIRLSIGELLAVDSAALQFSFDIVQKATVCDGATLNIITIPGKALCGACQNTVRILKYAEPCEFCGDFSLTIMQGEELQIKSMEVI